MQITASRSFRHHLLTTCAVAAWAVAATLFVVLAVIGERYPLHVALLFCLTVATTTTMAGVVTAAQSPAEALYGHIYNAGKQDCSRPHAQPVLVPEGDIERRRSQRKQVDVS